MPTYYTDPVNGNDANDGGGWWKLAFASGTGPQPAAGETVTGAGGATAKIIKVTGTWATSGTLYLYNRNATAFANGEAITFSGGGACVNAQGTPYDAVVASFKTLKKTFAAGDTINVAKSPETAAAGTVTATTGSLSVATTNDLTAVCPQYTLIRIGGDNTLYMVAAISSSVITLYRPYRGVTGSGKGLTYFTGLPTSASGDWTPTSMVGTVANPIIITCGINNSDQQQDGYTILYGNNVANIMSGTFTYANIDRLAFLYTQNGSNATMNNCSLTNHFRFRTTNLYGTHNNCTFTNIVVEVGDFPYNGAMNNCIVDNLETANPSLAGMRIGGALHNNMIINSWRNAGYSGQVAIKTSGIINNVRIVNGLFDELGVGVTNIAPYTGVTYIVNGFYIYNPTFSKGLIYDKTNGGLSGQITIDYGVSGIYDHMVISGNGENTAVYTSLIMDNYVYRTGVPSARIDLYQSTLPTIFRHYIPCDAGVAKTISVYMMKNSNPAKTFTINAAGTGYAVGDFILVNQGGANGCILQVLTLSGSGVATVRLISGGYNYSVANALVTTTLTGGGSGCKINITAIDTGYGSSTLPIMRLYWITGSPGSYVMNTFDTTLADTPNTWQQLSKAVTPSVKGAIIMALIFQSANTNAVAWYDDIGVA